MVSTHHVNTSDELNFNTQMVRFLSWWQAQHDSPCYIFRCFEGKQGSHFRVWSNLRVSNLPEWIFAHSPRRVVAHGNNLRVFSRVQVDFDLEAASAQTKKILNKSCVEIEDR